MLNKSFENLSKTHSEENVFEAKKSQTIMNKHMKKEGKHPIFRIALTGGPCAGKSTCKFLIIFSIDNDDNMA
jgi:putative protein kinase ArgK-like GTPase of G3E family